MAHQLMWKTWTVFYHADNMSIPKILYFLCDMREWEKKMEWCTLNSSPSSIAEKQLCSCHLNRSIEFHSGTFYWLDMCRIVEQWCINYNWIFLCIFSRIFFCSSVCLLPLHSSPCLFLFISVKIEIIHTFFTNYFH